MFHLLLFTLILLLMFFICWGITTLYDMYGATEFDLISKLTYMGVDPNERLY